MYRPKPANSSVPQVVASQVDVEEPKAENSPQFAVLYRKKSTKKHKVWEGDATAIQKGDSYLIKDGGKTLTTLPGARFVQFQELSCGSYELEIGEALGAPQGAPAAKPKPALRPMSKPAIESTASLFVQSAPPASGSVSSSPMALSDLFQKAPKAALLVRPDNPAKRAKVDPKPAEDEIVKPSEETITKPKDTAKLTPKASPRAKAPKAAKVAKAPAKAPKSKSKQMAQPRQKVLQVSDLTSAPTTASAPVAATLNWQIAPELAPKLRPHQLEAVEFLHQCVQGTKHAYGSGAILADDMGLGKTLTSITLIYSMLQAQEIETVLIACPATLVKNWRNEFRKWLPKEAVGVLALLPGEDPAIFCRAGGLRRTYAVLVAGYERIKALGPHVKAGISQFDLVVCDEGHRLKSQDSKALASIEDVAGLKRVILSGTPVQNNLEEFRVMSNFVNPGIFSSASKFGRTFSEAISRARASDAGSQERAHGAERMQELAEIAADFVLRRDHTVLQGHLTVPKQEVLLFCTPTKEQRLAYQQELEQTYFWESESAHSLALITRLRRISTSAHEPVATAGNFRQQLEKMAPLQGSNKLKVLEAMLSALHAAQNGEKVVVVSGFLETLDLVQQLCGKSNWSWVRLDGSTPQAQRQPMVDQFNAAKQEQAFVFILSAKSGGTGLNLVGASRLFMMDCDWNPSTDLQAMARVHRDGQLRPTFIYRLFSTGTIDEKILQRQITKQGVSDSLFDVSGEAEKFTRQQLREIFAFRECVKCDTVDNGVRLDYSENNDEEFVLDAARHTQLVSCAMRKNS